MGFSVRMGCRRNILNRTPPSIGGDLRAATNEGWWWLAAAGYWVVFRRFTTNAGVAFAMTGLLISLGVLLAVHTLHQFYVSLPQTMREYLANPDEQLARAGINAPPGSAARMIFENRLRDGGPTATFALANSLAGPLAMMAAACFAFLIEIRGRHRDIPGFTAIVVAALAVTAIALTVSGSRSGVLSVIIAMVAMVAFSFDRMRMAITKRVVVIALLSISLITLLAVMIPSRDAWTKAPATIQLRLQYWRSTLAMVWDHPWFGIGPGNFQLAYQTVPRHHRPRTDRRTTQFFL